MTSLKLSPAFKRYACVVVSSLSIALTSRHLCSCKCIDGCAMDAESSSKRLKLLQDISSLSGLFPRQYWISDITKGDRISGGGEATIHCLRDSTTAVIREFHLPLRIREAENVKRVRSFDLLHRLRPG